MDDSMVWYASDFQTIVIDNGSTNIRAGLATEAAPISIFPTVVGHPKDPNMSVGMGLRGAYVGDQIGESMRSNLVERHPIERGLITNWDDMEKIWHHTFYNELRVDPAEYPILLTEVGLNPKTHREKITQIMFETFDVPALYLSPAAALALYGYNRVTGVVLSSGGGITQAIPVYDLHPIQHGITQLDIGGNDITTQLIKLIKDGHNMDFCTRKERGEINYLKTRCTFVAEDYQHELQNFSEDTKYDVFDGHITLRKERFQAPEILFDPKLFGRENCGVHEMIVNSVMQSDESLRKTLFENIAVAGGNATIPGFTDRLRKELTKIVPEEFNSHVIPAGDAKNATWLGASRLGGNSMFLRLCMSKQEYDELGPKLVRTQF